MREKGKVFPEVHLICWLMQSVLFLQVVLLSMMVVVVVIVMAKKRAFPFEYFDCSQPHHQFVLVLSSYSVQREKSKIKELFGSTLDSRNHNFLSIKW
jgi:hypothetical protein